MVKCPACGFDSPEGAQWCEFCKEPFNKKPKPAGAIALPAAPAVGPKGPISAGAAAKKGPEPSDGIPPEFLALDSGEKIPALPPWVKYVAWAILGIWFVGLMAMTGYYLARSKTSN